MKAMRNLWAAWAAIALLAPGMGAAQVVREDGVKSIAGVFYTAPGMPTTAEWMFKSAGGEVLFASLDADIYREFAEHESVATAAAEEEEGGPRLFRLKVLDAYGQTVCSAFRPAPPPGWMRDPRMACVLPATHVPTDYRVRVELVVPAGHAMQPSYGFLLNLSLRKIAASGTTLRSAIAASSTGGF